MVKNAWMATQELVSRFKKKLLEEVIEQQLQRLQYAELMQWTKIQI